VFTEGGGNSSIYDVVDPMRHQECHEAGKAVTNLRLFPTISSCFSMSPDEKAIDSRSSGVCIPTPGQVPFSGTSDFPRGLPIFLLKSNYSEGGSDRKWRDYIGNSVLLGRCGFPNAQDEPPARPQIIMVLPSSLVPFSGGEG